MNDLAMWHNDVIGQRAVEALNKHNFSAHYFGNRQEAVDYVLQLIPDGATIGMGGSKTAIELGLWELVSERGHEIFNHNQPRLSLEEKTERRYKQLTCDVFLTSANAITLTGEIVNRDGNGNRVAAMMFGPKRVIIIAGTNKIVRDLEEADKRIKMYAAPMNNKRFESPNPCVQLGECVDCNSPQRSCRITTILSRRPPLTDIHVVLVGKNLGF
ncbi:L-lactate utilization protein LutB [Sporomusaceae bacterium BoRhaA]|uniref:lactate utilization protein n=1 Tax=Pelorhabdus rhamnosifermentans TaxID=2772457 RepID=UPI001C063C2C|nr:lactate utilization protein [Pelorhabdus rhamnosifermentans]MBU2702724.1 L-lactate utilization protein LutB [Pelorhabdus rhamnosifermentans]